MKDWDNDEIDPLLRNYICDPDFTNIRPVGLMTWARWMEGKNRHVDRTETDRGFVSTVFLGIDHNFAFSGPPVLFETMIFAPGYACDEDQHRYTNVADARAGHAACVMTLKTSPKVWESM